MLSPIPDDLEAIGQQVEKKLTGCGQALTREMMNSIQTRMILNALVDLRRYCVALQQIGK
jgi:hypothetical protein